MSRTFAYVRLHHIFVELPFSKMWRQNALPLLLLYNTFILTAAFPAPADLQNVHEQFSSPLRYFFTAETTKRTTDSAFHPDATDATGIGSTIDFAVADTSSAFDPNLASAAVIASTTDDHVSETSGFTILKTSMLRGVIIGSSRLQVLHSPR